MAQTSKVAGLFLYVATALTGCGQEYALEEQRCRNFDDSVAGLVEAAVDEFNLKVAGGYKMMPDIQKHTYYVLIPPQGPVWVDVRHSIASSLVDLNQRIPHMAAEAGCQIPRTEAAFEAASLISGNYVAHITASLEDKKKRQIPAVVMPQMIIEPETQI